jgi:hypothetical protein
VHKAAMFLDGIDHGINCKGIRMLFSVLQNLILVSFQMVPNSHAPCGLLNLMFRPPVLYIFFLPRMSRDIHKAQTCSLELVFLLKLNIQMEKLNLKLE